MTVAAISGPSSVYPPLFVRPANLALPPYLAPITGSDPDGDGDNDRGTIVDTFA